MPRSRSVPRLAIFLALLALPLALLLAVSSCCRGTRETKQQGESLTLSLSPAAESKVDPEVRRSASRLLADRRGKEEILVLVRIKDSESSDSGARETLENAGMKVESIVGEVVSGRIPARALAQVAALDLVIQIEPAREMEIK